MLLTVYDDEDNPLILSLVWDDNILSMVSEDEDVNVFTEGTYKLEINGLITPTTHENGVPSLFFRRKTDQAIVL